MHDSGSEPESRYDSHHKDLFPSRSSVKYLRQGLILIRYVSEGSIWNVMVAQLWHSLVGTEFP
jgi:hypothetical protein